MERAQFEEERAKILEKAQLGLDQINNNLNRLNRNIETINSIGKQFEAPAQLWGSFHKAIGASDIDLKNHMAPDLSIVENSNKPVSEGENERI